ncbi:MAG: hypothetical protein JO208_05510 [Alphaproteobacteria bacterium]|nr:hypothetical protein [Alphaproteobacteria bacterium]
MAISPVRDADGQSAIFAGTGEGFSNVDAIQGAGIFWSTDGVRWSQLPSANTPDFRAVNRLAMSSDGTALLAATPTGLLRTESPAFSAWSKTLNIAVADVKCHPSNPLLATAGGLSNGAAYVSSDGGKSWNEANHSGTWGSRVELAYALADPTIVYASVDINGGSIWRSTDGGKNYRPMKTQTAAKAQISYLGDQGWYANAIWAGDPSDANAVLVGGLDLWRSLDGGNTLEQISVWYEPASVHADHHCIVSRAGAGAALTVYFGNDGGLFATADYKTVGGGADLSQGWERLDNGYGVTQFYGAACRSRDGTLIAGAQDNGTLRYTSGGGAAGWTTMFGGDGGACAYDAKNDIFYGEYVYGQITRSTDGGQSAEYICGQYFDSATQRWRWRPPPYLIPDAAGSRQALFIAPFAVDPLVPDRLLVGGLSVWRTNDARTQNDDHALTGPKWLSIKDSIRDYVSALGICPDKSDVVWVGHASGAIFETSNGTAQRPGWRQVGGGTGQNLSIPRYCSCLLVRPHGLQIFVTFAAYAAGSAGSNVWKTEDSGSSWVDIGGALPDAPVHKIAVHPQHAEFLYVGTEIGLFASDDAGGHWSPTNEGPTNCPVYDLIWDGTKLIAVTHGRGTFAINIA